MKPPESFQEAGNILNSAQNILIALSKSVIFDQVASALSLYLSLMKRGKNVQVASSSEMIVEFSHLVGVDKIVSRLSGQDLVLTLNYPLQNIEKVSSNNEGERLNLVIQPKVGSPPLRQEDILFSSSGSRAEAILVMGARKLEDLGPLFSENQDLFLNCPIINLDNQEENTNFGKVNLCQPAASLSETTTLFLKNLGLPLNEDVASNLLLGLRSSTNNFTSQNVSAETFEAAALCLRGGGRKPEPEEAKREEETLSETPPDWLEPKVYKGSTLP